ncbi:hypothetical protein ABOONEI_2683 [Aciduliprofundum boonei T469]|nr:hypothetical protein ABOONEI_2683 [Aciduliprofundum boonei T469]
MNVSWFLLETSVGNIMWHIFLGFLAGILLLPKRRGKFVSALILAIIMEAITDGAHLVNKDITHNLIFFWQLPLALILIDYIYDSRKRFMPLLLTIFGINMTHIYSDAILEGDNLAIFYPISSQWYAYRTTIFGMNAAILGTIIFLATMAVLYIVSRKVYSTSNSSSWPHRKEMRKYNLPSFITTVAFLIRAL